MSHRRRAAAPLLAVTLTAAVAAPLTPAYGNRDGGRDDEGRAQFTQSWSSTNGAGNGASNGDKNQQGSRPPQGDKNPGRTPQDDEPASQVLQGAFLGAVVTTTHDLSAKPTAAPQTAFQMPFPCGEVWTGTTRSSHSPSTRSVDFNGPDDFGASVVAAADGTVTTAVTGKNRPSYGQFVVIEHLNGESSLYAHLDSVLVTVGDAVTAGTPIGTLGNTGNSSGAHLHFEQRSGSSVIDSWFDGARYVFGTAQESRNCVTVAIPDIPLAGNVLGSRKAELVTFRREGRPGFRIQRVDKPEKVIPFGAPHNQPLLGDWDGDGKASPGARDTTTKTFTLKQGRTVTSIRFGGRKDLALAGDWDGDGVWDLGVRTSKGNLFKLRAADGRVTKMRLGDADDIPVVGDWDGDGDTDLGVFDRETATFTLQKVDPTGMYWLDQVQFGEPGEIPLAADWDGNGVTDLGVWNPATATYRMRIADSPASKRATVKRTAFGQGR
jgi:murein DD-endopeptidase MepM/ murein hydrolase activator NlpD